MLPDLFSLRKQHSFIQHLRSERLDEEKIKGVSKLAANRRSRASA